MTHPVKAFALATFVLGLAACNSNSETATTVENDLEEAANRSSEALENAGESFSDAANAIGNQISYKFDELKANLNDENRDLHDDLVEAGGYINQRLDEINAEMKTATEEQKEELKLERNELVVAGKRIGEDLNSFGDKAKEDFKTFEANTRAYINQIDLDIDLDDDKRDYELN